MRLLVDGDLLIFRCGFAAERMEYKVCYTDAESGEDVRVWCEYKKSADELAANLGKRGVVCSILAERRLEPLSHATKNIRQLLDSIEDATCPNNTTVFFSGGRNFRYDVATIKPYKGNRDKAHRPTYENEMKEYVRKNYDTVTSDGQEADDDLGIAQWTAHQDDPHSTCIASADKDLRMIPGLHYNFLKDDPASYVGEQAAMHTFMRQWVTGDSTDNIPGVPKIGPAKADKAFEGCATVEDMMEVVRTLYIQGYAKEWEPAMLENGRLLWIRREVNELFDHRFIMKYGTSRGV